MVVETRKVKEACRGGPGEYDIQRWVGMDHTWDIIPYFECSPAWIVLRRYLCKNITRIASGLFCRRIVAVLPQPGTDSSRVKLCTCIDSAVLKADP